MGKIVALFGAQLGWVISWHVVAFFFNFDVLGVRL
jgi:hypothetical protein